LLKASADALAAVHEIIGISNSNGRRDAALVRIGPPRGTAGSAQQQKSGPRIRRVSGRLSEPNSCVQSVIACDRGAHHGRDQARSNGASRDEATARERLANGKSDQVAHCIILSKGLVPGVA
jgi:hypothetical protein